MSSVLRPVVLTGARPKGYSAGIVASGKVLHISGHVGWDSPGVFSKKTLPEQFARALDHVLEVVRAAGGTPNAIAEMTIYVTDIDAYRSSLKEIGAHWKARLGAHFPAMALVGVASLVEPEALVEVQAVAYLEEVP